MKIYVLSEYNYSPYSYDGIDVQCEHYFSSRELAEAYAIKLGLKVVEFVKNVPTDCTITEETLVTE
jgi:hypothetical protein